GSPAHPALPYRRPLVVVVLVAVVIARRRNRHGGPDVAVLLHAAVHRLGLVVPRLPRALAAVRRCPREVPVERVPVSPLPSHLCSAPARQQRSRERCNLKQLHVATPQLPRRDSTDTNANSPTSQRSPSPRPDPARRWQSSSFAFLLVTRLHALLGS